MVVPKLQAGSHALLTRPPLNVRPKTNTPFDLHVLGAPPAFVLSQDQTLNLSPSPTLIRRCQSRLYHCHDINPDQSRNPSPNHACKVPRTPRSPSGLNPTTTSALKGQQAQSSNHLLNRTRYAQSA